MVGQGSAGRLFFAWPFGGATTAGKPLRNFAMMEVSFRRGRGI